MATVTIDLPDDAFAALRRSPKEFSQEMRLAAAMLWYAQGRISHEKAAQVAGVSRIAFIDALAAAKLPAFHVDVDELMEEVARLVVFLVRLTKSLVVIDSSQYLDSRIMQPPCESSRPTEEIDGLYHPDLRLGRPFTKIAPAQATTPVRGQPNNAERCVPVRRGSGRADESRLPVQVVSDKGPISGILTPLNRPAILPHRPAVTAAEGFAGVKLGIGYWYQFD